MATKKETIATIRFGYGFRPDQPPPKGPDDLMAQLPLGRMFDDELGGLSLKRRAARFTKSAKLRESGLDDAKRAKMRAINQEIRADHRADAVRRIFAPVRSPHGFFERLAWFWSSHFAVAGKGLLGKAIVGRYEVEAIRPHVAGSFRDMLRAATTHPAMLHYLDQQRSVGPNSPAGLEKGAGLNENLAREIIELHTLGVDAPYTQRDVREFAELLTGLAFRRRDGTRVYRRKRAEPGVERVLGRTYGGDPPELRDIHRALDDLAAHPATARRIAFKLARHFTSDEPSESLVDHIAAAFARSDGDLPTVYAAMLEHDESWSTFGAKIKQPFDFAVSTLRAIGPDRKMDAAAAGRDAPKPDVLKGLRAMNQDVFKPPGPQGWPEAAARWITPQGLTRRIEWASRVGRAAAAANDPREVLSVALGPLASAETVFAATQAAEKWEGVALALASPEFNRR